MSGKTNVEIGFNVRHWKTLWIDDVTEMEALILQNNDEASVELLGEMERAGRITERDDTETWDQSPVIIGTDLVETGVISVWSDEA